MCPSRPHRVFLLWEPAGCLVEWGSDETEEVVVGPSHGLCVTLPPFLFPQNMLLRPGW